MTKLGAALACTLSLLACGELDVGTESAAPPAGHSGAGGAVQDRGPWLVVAHYDDDTALMALAALVDHYRPEPDDRAVRLHVDDADHWRRLEAAGFSLTVDRVETDAMQRDLARAATVRSLGGPPAGIPGFECYRTVDETYATAELLAAENPTLVEWLDIGDTWLKQEGLGGDDLMLIKVTNQAIEGPKPILWLTGSIHARELAPAELVTRFVEQLVERYGVDADATWIVDHHEIHAVLQANPDGRRVTEAGTARRKNANASYCGTSATNRGVDLNRNWPFKFGVRGTSTSPCSGSFRGPEAMSEPESAAYVTYMRSIFPDQRDEAAGDFEPAPDDATGIYIDVHSFGELVMWPYGFTEADNGNIESFRAFGQRMAFFSGYSPVNLLPSSGSTAGTGYGELGIAAMAFELGTSFFQSCGSFEASVAPDNLASLLYAAKVARAPYLTPFGPDVLSLAADAADVPAGQTVTVTAIADDARFQARAGSPSLPPIETIARVEVFVDTPPWEPGATAVGFAADDGAFDDSSEAVTLELDTSTLDSGRHMLFARAVDAADNAGPVSALFLHVAPNQAPGVTIDAPDDGGTSGPDVDLAGTATDPEEGDLSDIIDWSSDLDGALGVGRSLSVALSDGRHAITAEVTDGVGNQAFASIELTVSRAGDGGDPDAGPGVDGGTGGDDGGDSDGSDGAGSDGGNGGTDSGGCGCSVAASSDGASASLLILVGLALTRRRRRRARG